MLLGGGGGGALLCAVTAPGAAPPGPGIGGTLLARWAEVTGVVDDVGDVSVEPMLDLSKALTIAVACGCRGLLGSDGTGPACGNTGGLSGLEERAPSFSEVVRRRLRFTAGVSFSESEPAFIGVGWVGGGRGSGRAMLISTQMGLSSPN